jgi:hypothetical protein
VLGTFTSAIPRPSFPATASRPGCPQEIPESRRERLAHPHRLGVVDPVEQVGVDPERRRRVGMFELAADEDDVEPLRDQKVRERVPAVL